MSGRLTIIGTGPGAPEHTWPHIDAFLDEQQAAARA